MEKRIVGVCCRRGEGGRIVSAEPIIKEVEVSREREREHLKAFGAALARIYLDKEAKDDIRTGTDSAGHR